MAFDLKVCLVTDGSELVNGEADIYVYHAVTLCAGQVMVMVISTDAVVMRSVGKLDAIQQAHTDKLFHRTENRCPSEARLYLPEFVPEVIGGKVGSSRGQFYQPLGNEPPRARTALAYFVERRSNFICYHLYILFPNTKEDAVPALVPSLPLSAQPDKLSLGRPQ